MKPNETPPRCPYLCPCVVLLEIVGLVSFLHCAIRMEISFSSFFFLFSLGGGEGDEEFEYQSIKHAIPFSLIHRILPTTITTRSGRGLPGIQSIHGRHARLSTRRRFVDVQHDMIARW